MIEMINDVAFANHPAVISFSPGQVCLMLHFCATVHNILF